MNTLLALVIQIPCVIFATTLHEFSRAVVSTVLGDKKPKNDGRLTINPAKHFEPVGFILAWITGFGWGKPVETSSIFYKNRKRDTLIAAIAPSVINILAAVVFSLIYKFVPQNIIAYTFIVNLIRYNVSLAVYNIVPFTPMDGLKVLSAVMPANTYFKYIQYEKIIQMVFLLLLFMGYTDIIFSPIITLFTALIMYL